MLSLKIKRYPLPGLHGENARTTVSCLEYGCHLGAEQGKCREISSQNLNCEPTWWPDTLLHKAINTVEAQILGKKKRKRSGRKPLLKWWFTKRQSPVQSQTTRFTTKSLSSQASQHVQRGAVVFHLTFFCSLKNCSLIHFFWKTIFLCEVADYKKCSETNEVSLNHNDSQRQSQKSYTETRVTKKASRKQLPEALPYLFLLLRNYAVSKQVRAAVHRILLFHHSAVTGFILVS